MNERNTDLFGESGELRDEKLRRTLSFALSSLKTSVERGVPRRLLEDDEDFALAWKNAVLRIEGVRVELSTLLGRAHSPGRVSAVLQRVHEDLAALLDDRDFIEFVSELRYRPIGPNPTRDDIDPRVLDRDGTIPDLIATLVAISRGVVMDASPQRGDIASLRRIIPSQKIAPVRFDVVDGRLTVVAQPAEVLAEDHDNVAASRDALIERGEQLLQALEQSNCDRRLVESVRELHHGLASNQNIIQLGLSNITCEAICGAFQSELPDALCGKLQGQIRGVAMYLAQFPEWQKFSEKAAAVDLDADDIRRISTTARTLVADLEANPAIADPEVPRTIAALREAISDPSRATKRAAFAVMRTIENLVAKAVEYGAELIDSTINKSIADISSTASKVIVIGLLSAALGGASGLAPIAGKVSETAWLRTVAEVVRDQITAASQAIP